MVGKHKTSSRGLHRSASSVECISSIRDCIFCSVGTDHTAVAQADLLRMKLPLHPESDSLSTTARLRWSR